MKSPVWIAGGTTEGRKLAHYADCCHIRAYVSVATDYGASLVTESPFVTVVTGRMDEGEMETFLREHAAASSAGAAAMRTRVAASPSIPSAKPSKS